MNPVPKLLLTLLLKQTGASQTILTDCATYQQIPALIPLAVPIRLIQDSLDCYAYYRDQRSNVGGDKTVTSVVCQYILYECILHMFTTEDLYHMSNCKITTKDMYRVSNCKRTTMSLPVGKCKALIIALISAPYFLWRTILYENVLHLCAYI